MSRKAGRNWWNGFVGTTMESEPLRANDDNEIRGVIVQPDPVAPKFVPLSQETGLTASSRSDFTEEIRHDLSLSGQRRDIQSRLKDYFAPSDLPDEIQLLNWKNLAIPVCYLVVGTLQGLFRTLLNVYPLGLGATEAQQTTLSTIATIPAAFKMVYGFTTDNIPLFGYRRKPYIFMGWVFASFMMLQLILTSDLTMAWDPETGDPVPPEGAPSITQLSVTFLLFGISMWFADATMDAVVVEKARCEPTDRRGSLQSTCYAFRFAGLMVCAPLSNYLYTHVGPQIVVHILMLVPTVMFPLSLVMEEECDLPLASFRDQCTDIWQTVCSRSIWEPMGFIYLFNLCQVPNAAWRQFLRTVLHFTDVQLNNLLVASYTMLYAGTMIYKYCFLHASWRRIYLGCILMNAVFSALQLLLIRGNTFGLTPFLFALGDDAMAEFISGVQFLPTAILMVALTPAGSEGAAYAMYTTVWNSAMMIAPAVSSVLLEIWDTSVETMKAGQLDGLFNLSLLTTGLQVLPVLFLCWMPHGRDELHALAGKTGSGHAAGGVIFLAILGMSMAWTLAVAVLNIIRPGWAGAS